MLSYALVSSLLFCPVLFYHHLFAHVCDVVETNPREEWNYMDEAEIGHGVLLAQQTNVNYIPSVMMTRYRVAFR